MQLSMMEKTVESVQTCFGKYSPVIYVVSLAKANSNTDNNIRKYVKKFCSGMNFFVLNFDINVSHIIPFPKNAERRLGYNALSRFFLPYILPCEYTYYIDTDTFFTKDIYKKLINFDHKHTLLRIWNIHYYKDYRPSDHINSGFIYINCELWKKKENIFADILGYYANNNTKILYPNQDCYTWIVTDKYKNDCVVENDLLVNNRMLFDDVELVHVVGEQKSLFFDLYKEYKNKSSC